MHLCMGVSDMRRSLRTPFWQRTGRRCGGTVGESTLSATMADLDMSVQRLESNVEKLAQRIANIEGRLEVADRSPKWWVVLILTLIAGAVVTFWGWAAKEIYGFNGKISAIEEKIESINTLLTPERLKKLAFGEPTKANLAQTRQLIEKAESQKIIMDPGVVTVVGNKLLQTASEKADVSQHAWDALSQLLSYRTLLNAAEDQTYKPPTGPIKRAEAIRIAPGSRVHVEDSMIDGFEQTLDGGIWVNVTFVIA